MLLMTTAVAYGTEECQSFKLPREERAHVLKEARALVRRQVDRQSIHACLYPAYVEVFLATVRETQADGAMLRDTIVCGRKRFQHQKWACEHGVERSVRVLPGISMPISGVVLQPWMSVGEAQRIVSRIDERLSSLTDADACQKDAAQLNLEELRVAFLRKDGDEPYFHGEDSSQLELHRGNHFVRLKPKTPDPGVPMVDCWGREDYL